MSIPLPGTLTIIVLVALFFLLRRLGLFGVGLIAWVGDEFIHDWWKQRKSARDRRRKLNF